MQEEYRKTAAREEATALAAMVNGRQPVNNASIADELEKIYELKQKGILTEDEFNNLKIKILRT